MDDPTPEAIEEDRPVTAQDLAETPPDWEPRTVAPGLIPDNSEEETRGEGTTEGTELVVPAEALDGAFVYGISAEVGSALTQLGNTTAGVIAIPAVLELESDRLTIRVLDGDEPVPGDEGVVESYPAVLTDDGDVRIDFSMPIDFLEIHLYQECTYMLDGYELVNDPVLADGLMTWPALEHYESNQCQGGGFPPSFGLNVHFLRRMDANETFVPRATDPESPFGFFQIADPDGSDQTLLTRLPHAGEGHEDGQVVYHISPSFPEELRPAIFEVLEDWNDVFEEQAGNRPFAVVDGDADLIPWDPRFRVIHWDASETKGAVAPFIEDPITGEMFATHVVFWLGNFSEMVEKYMEYIEKNPDEEWADFEPSETGQLPVGWTDDGDVSPNVLRRRPMQTRPFRWSEIRSRFLKSGAELSEEELSLYIIADFLVHEIGHNIGLRHNFKASVDDEHFDEGHPSSSVMDYILGMAVPGLYDRAAVRYAYGDNVAEPGFLYCTDEHVELDPGCAMYDHGHPVLYFLGVLDRMAEKYPPGTSNSEIEDHAEEEEWNKVFRRVRQFFNTEYETMDPEVEADTFQSLLSRVLCEEECAIHDWFRETFALYLLYTKHAVQAAWEPGSQSQWTWIDFPPLTDEQATELLETYFQLVTNPAFSLELKKTIINKLPTANVPGAKDLLDTLDAYFSEIEEPSEEDQELIDSISNAQADVT